MDRRTKDGGGMAQQGWPGGRHAVRSWWWQAWWAAVIAVTVVVSSGAVLLAARVVGGGSRPAPTGLVLPAATGTTAATAQPRTTDQTRTTAPVAPTGRSAPAAATSRLVLIGPRRVVNERRLAAGAEVPVPLPGVTPGANAVLLEVSVLAARGAGAVTLVSGSTETPVLLVAGPGAQTSATVVARLGSNDGTRHRLAARFAGGGDLVVTLSGQFVPASTATAGRIVPVPAEQALDLRPGQDGNRATIDPRDLSLSGTPGTQVTGLLLSFQADVGSNGGTVAIGRAWDRLDQRAYWGATAGADRTRRAFLVVPLTGRLRLFYHAGTRLRVDVVGVVTGPRAARDSVGLAVPVAPTALPALTVPAGGQADVRLPGADDATAALVTTAVTPAGGRRRAVLGLLPVRAGTVQLTAPARAEVSLIPRLLIR